LDKSLVPRLVAYIGLGKEWIQNCRTCHKIIVLCSWVKVAYNLCMDNTSIGIMFVGAVIGP